MVAFSAHAVRWPWIADAGRRGAKGDSASGTDSFGPWRSCAARRGQIYGRTRNWKKAIVHVAEGDTIPIFQGLESLED